MTSNQQPSQVPFTFSFAAAMPPRCEQMLPSHDWLRQVAEAGYSHVCVQNDPFWNGESFRLLSVFDVAVGPNRRGYREWLTTIADRASQHGLRLAVQVWEPRVNEAALVACEEGWLRPSPGAAHPVVAEAGGQQVLCLGVPQARAWFLEAFADLMRAVPQLDTLVLGVNDNSAFLCDETCPVCGAQPQHERLAEVYREVAASCRQIRQDTRVVAYDWGYDILPEETRGRILEGLPAGSGVLTRMEKGAVHVPDASHPQWQGPVFDMSMGCDQLGPDFEQARRAAHDAGSTLLVMITLSGMWEAWDLPYVPALGQMAATFDRMRSERVAGWVDYDCGGVHAGLMLDLVRTVQHAPADGVEEWLDRLAADRYGPGASADHARAAWRHFDAAVRVMPTQLQMPDVGGNFSGRFGAATALVPLHPFLPERARVGRDQGHEHFWFDPHNLLVPQALQPVRYLLGRALEHATAGLAELEQAVAATSGEPAEWTAGDLDVARLVVLGWESVANFYAWAAAVREEAPGDVEKIVRSEIELTEQYLELYTRPELEAGNMTWRVARMIATSVRGDALERWCIDVNRPETAGDVWGWKLTSLRRQLDTPV